VDSLQSLEAITQIGVVTGTIKGSQFCYTCNIFIFSSGERVLNWSFKTFKAFIPHQYIIGPETRKCSHANMLDYIIISLLS